MTDDTYTQYQYTQYGPSKPSKVWLQDGSSINPLTCTDSNTYCAIAHGVTTEDQCTNIAKQINEFNYAVNQELTINLGTDSAFYDKAYVPQPKGTESASASCAECWTNGNKLTCSYCPPDNDTGHSCDGHTCTDKLYNARNKLSSIESEQQTAQYAVACTDCTESLSSLNSKLECAKPETGNPPCADYPASIYTNDDPKTQLDKLEVERVKLETYIRRLTYQTIDLDSCDCGAQNNNGTLECVPCGPDTYNTAPVCAITFTGEAWWDQNTPGSFHDAFESLISCPANSEIRVGDTTCSCQAGYKPTDPNDPSNAKGACTPCTSDDFLRNLYCPGGASVHDVDYEPPSCGYENVTVGSDCIPADSANSLQKMRAGYYTALCRGGFAAGHCYCAGLVSPDDPYPSATRCGETIGDAMYKYCDDVQTNTNMEQTMCALTRVGIDTDYRDIPQSIRDSIVVVASNSDGYYNKPGCATYIEVDGTYDNTSFNHACAYEDGSGNLTTLSDWPGTCDTNPCALTSDQPNVPAYTDNVNYCKTGYTPVQPGPSACPNYSSSEPPAGAIVANIVAGIGAGDAPGAFEAAVSIIEGIGIIPM